MVINDIWFALSRDGIQAALDVLKNCPESNPALSPLIQKCLIEFDGYLFIPDAKKTEFENRIAWLSDLSINHDIDDIFRDWLEKVENGFALPGSKAFRVNVLSELMNDTRPLFEFEPGALSLEQQFLLDFGFAVQKTVSEAADAKL